CAAFMPFFFQAEDGIRDFHVTGVQTCALPILERIAAAATGVTAIVGWPETAGSVVYNAASILRGGRIEHTYRKRELPNYAVFDRSEERRVGKECRSRWSSYEAKEKRKRKHAVV